MIENDKQLQIKHWLATGELTREQLMACLEEDVTTATEPVPPSIGKRFSFFSLRNLLYLLGGLLLISGLVAFIAQIWSDIGSFGRVIVTFGLGATLYSFGISYTRLGQWYIGTVLLSVGSVLLLVGMPVVLFEVNVLTTFNSTVGWLLLGSLFLSTGLWLRTTAGIFFAFATLTGALYSTLYLLTTEWGLNYRETITLWQYLTIVVGGSYLYLGLQVIPTTFARSLAPLLLFFGVNAFLGVLFAKMSDGLFWELVYPLVAIGVIAIATTLSKMLLLVFGMLYLFGYFIYITGTYFANSIGWPLALIILGVILLGLGYVSVQLYQRFFQTSGR